MDLKKGKTHGIIGATEEKKVDKKEHPNESTFNKYIKKIGNHFSKGSMGIFIFLLIISGNYLGGLFPCRVQESFEKSIWLKHFLGYFTLLFFVLFTMENTTKDVNKILGGSFLLYIIFLVISSTPEYVWITVFVVCAIIYVFELKKNEYKELIKNESDKSSSNIKLHNSKIELLSNLQFYFSIFSIIIIVIGVFIYMGEKKIEYGKNFDYFKFLFNSPSCRGKTKPTTILQSLKHSLD